MSEEGSRRKKRGLFGRKKRGENSSRGTVSQASSIDGESAANNSGEGRRKRRGLGRQIRRLVGGRKKSKSAGDDVSTVEVYDKDDPNYRGPRTGLDADILAQVLSKDEPEKQAESPYIAAGRFNSIDEGDEEEEEDSDSENAAKLYGVDDEDDISEQGELLGPLELVLVLVDPRTLRFELLQLEFETPQLSKVSECLEQVKDIVTESALKSLEFHSVLDRKGNSFPAKASLGKALTCRRRGKDILVGISKGVSADEAGRLARPILGDAKVIQMLETNGYRVKGWAKDQTEQSELKDAKKDKFAVAERKRQLRVLSIVFCVALVAYLIYGLSQYFFGASPLKVAGAAIENMADSSSGATTVGTSKVAFDTATSVA